MARKTGRKNTRRTRKTATARRAPRRSPAPAKAARRRPRRNPKGFFDMPAVRFAGAALVGGLVAFAVNKPDSELGKNLDPLTFKPEDASKPPMFSRSTAGALVTLGLSWFFAKGQTRALGLAAGVGMLLPAVQTYANKEDAPASTSSALLGAQRLKALAAPRAPRVPSPAARKLRDLNTGIIGA